MPENGRRRVRSACRGYVVERASVVRVAIFLATVVSIWGVLSLRASSNQDLVVGETAPSTFVAETPGAIVNVGAVEDLREQARADVNPVRESDLTVEASVEESLNYVFDQAELLVLAQPPASPVTTIPELPSTTTQPEVAEGSTTTTEQPAPATITGRVFLDFNHDGVLDSEVESGLPDKGLAGVEVEIRTNEEEPLMVVTNEEGTWFAEISGGVAVVTVTTTGSVIPTGWVFGADHASQLISCEAGAECEAEAVWFEPNLRSVEDAASEIAAIFDLPLDTAAYLATTASEDVIRAALGKPLHLPTIREAALRSMREEFGRNIQEDQLQDARSRLRTSPPLVFHQDTLQQDTEGGRAAGEIVARFLEANYIIDEAETEQRRQDAEESIPDDAVTVEYVEDEIIVEEGQRVTEFQLAAIQQTASLGTRVQAQGGLIALIAVLVGLMGLYLARFRPDLWSRPRSLALLGIILLLAAASIRGTSIVADATSSYVLPTVAFGFIAAVLFDSRIAVLTSVAVGVLAGVGLLDVGVPIYAALACIAPIPFVSAVSTRGAFRTAVVLSSLTAAVIAAATSWLFDVGPSDTVVNVVGVSLAWAFGVSVVASLVALAALQFFESSFDITTTLGLLDLTDRNHAALQLLQDKAFGTFNHSLMVGTLADSAARAIGANPLLARAMAYYHDLGKTEQPNLFIENQFGGANPHDELDPVESAQIIRNHVTAGVALAAEYKIPTDVTEGIVSHHGDAVMRYFYEKAREKHGDNVSIDDFRHVGHKPRTRETAILMLADSLEAACRAEFRTEEPTADAIDKVVDRVINEKVDDGQLSESPLTFSELSMMRTAFLGSLTGHYHQRIPYPNFPGT